MHTETGEEKRTRFQPTLSRSRLSLTNQDQQSNNINKWKNFLIWNADIKEYRTFFYFT